MTRILASLRVRLLLLVLLALVPAFGLIVYASSEQREYAATQVQQDALRLARAAAGNNQELIASARQLLMVLSQLPELNGRDPAGCKTFLAALNKQYPRYADMAVIDRNGTVLCSAIPISPTGIAHGTFFQRVLDSGEFVVGEYEIGRASGKAVTVFGHPIFDGERHVQAVVLASLDLGWLNQLAAQSQLPRGSTYTMADRNGTIVARYPDPEQWVGQYVPAAPIFQAIRRREAEGTVQAIGEDGVTRLYAFSPLGGAAEENGYVIVGIPADVAYAEVNRGMVRNLIALGAAGVLALAAAWFGGDFFLLRHVKALSRVTGRLADGDLTARTGLPYGGGELSGLARDFDRMAGNLQLREKEREQAEGRVLRWSARLEGLIHTVALAMSRPLDTSEIGDTALDGIVHVMELAAGCLFLRQEAKYALVSTTGLATTTIANLQRLAEVDAFNDGLSELALGGVKTIADNPLARALATSADTPRAWLAIPIKSKRGVSGLLCLAGENDQPLEAQEQAVLAAIGEELGVAIENAQFYQEIESIAALKERERLSRELHDGLAQLLGYLSLRTENAKDMITAGKGELAAAQLHEIQDAVLEAHQELRESILGLRTTVSPHGGLVSSLKEYLHRYGLQTGIHVDLTWDGEGRIPCSPEAEVQLLRIIQEALTNVRKHSSAKQAVIRFESRPDSTVVTIGDDGKGFDLNSIIQDGRRHLGLQSMRERAEGVGGSFQMASEPGSGTRIVVTFPSRKAK